MNEKYLYLALNLGSVVFPFIFSFIIKPYFYKDWKYAIPAILVVGVVFILWDEWFTSMRVWGFNSRYLTGIFIGHLPLEELLFFFCIPYACLFVYYVLRHFIRKNYTIPHEKIITLFLIIVLFIVGIFYADRWYTGVTFFGLSVSLFFIYFIGKVKYLGVFYISYLIIQIPFFIVNGVLTGSWIDEQVVWYNNGENLNIRIGTVPADDLFYNMLMLLLITGIYEFLKSRKHSK